MFLNRGLAFQANCWPQANIVIAKLTKIHRQGEDKELVQALKSLRKGKMTNQLIKVVRQCQRNLPEIEDERGLIIKPTNLFCKNKDVDSVNEMELKKLHGGNFGQLRYKGIDKIVYYKERLSPPNLKEIFQRLPTRPSLSECKIGQNKRLKTLKEMKETI